MRRIRLDRTTFVATLVVVVSSLGAFASPAMAHDSTYCGHGRDYGFLKEVVFVEHWNSGGRHYHKYRHYFFNKFTHTETQAC